MSEEKRDTRFSRKTETVPFIHWDGTFKELQKLFDEPVGARVNRKYRDQADIRYESESWYGKGIKSNADVFKLIQDGWPEGVKKASEFRDRMQKHALPDPLVRKRRQVWTDDGDYLDEDKALAGQWDTAYRVAKRRVTSGPPVIDLYFQFGGHCGKSANELMWSGVTAVTLADMLENAGYFTRISAFTYVFNGNSSLDYRRYDPKDGIAITVEVKAPEEPLRFDSVVVLSSHVGVFRTLGFRALLEMEGDATSCLGFHPDNAHETGFKLCEETGILEPGKYMYMQAFSEGQAERLIEAKVQELTKLVLGREEI